MHARLPVILGLLLLAFCGVPAARAQEGDAVKRSIELALSNHAGQLRYRAPSNLGGQPGSEVSYALFLSEQRDLVGSAALLFGTNLNLGPLHIQLGPQAYAALLKEENNDVFSLSIGTQLRYDILPSRAVSLVGHAYWSPDILTFGSADNLTDFMVRAEMLLGGRVTGFVGYRWFRLDLNVQPDQNLQNELFVGINWQL